MKNFVLIAFCVFMFLMSSLLSLDIKVLTDIEITRSGRYSYSDFVGISCGEMYIINNCQEYILSFGQFGYIDNKFDIHKFVKNNDIQINSIEYLEELDMKVYVMYTKKLRRYRIINNNKSNIQIAITNNYKKIGYPAIFDSF